MSQKKHLENILTKKFLIKEYIKKEKTYNQIAKNINVSKNSVIRWAKKYNIKSRTTGRKRIPIIIGKKYNSLLVLREKRIENQLFWECKCDCGNVFDISPSSLGESKQKTCWECRNKTIGDKNWRGYGDISGDFWGRIKSGAKERNYKIEITIKQIWDLFLKQNRRCALSGVPLQIYKYYKDSVKTTASLDRIDSSKNYTIDNVQWIHKTLNIIKMDISQEEFIKWCKKVSQYSYKNK